MNSNKTLDSNTIELLNQNLTDLEVTFEVKKKGEAVNLTQMKGEIAIEPHVFDDGNTMKGYYDLHCYTDGGTFSIALAKSDLVNIAVSETIIVIESKEYLYTLLIK